MSQATLGRPPTAHTIPTAPSTSRGLCGERTVISLTIQIGST